jgi:hypothetical protein
MTKYCLSMTTVAVCLLVALPAFAAPPKILSYQGYLKDAAGKPVTTAKSVVFSLYSSNPPRNNRIWSETRNVTPTNGVYSVSLGTITPLAVPFDVPYFLGVKVAGDPELTPLHPLTGAPYAFRAGTADSLNSAATITLPPNGLSVGTTQFVVSSGRVGIGTATPTAPLDVIGDIKMSGNITLPPTTITAGQIRQGTDTLLHTSGSGNFYAGLGAGNFGSYAMDNTAVGNQALHSNTMGVGNTAVGNAALSSNGLGAANTALGTYALLKNTRGDSNTAIGDRALQNNTMTNNNTAVGRYALWKQSYANGNQTWDTFNTAVGWMALSENQPTSSGNGIRNTALGAEALLNNTTGSWNTANGTQVLLSNITGSNNTATGHAALYSNNSGNNNTASGVQALFKNTSGENNTATGWQSLYWNAGNNNTAYGWQALAFNQTGSNNTAIGYTTGNNIVAGSNNIHIGAWGGGDESDTIRIGATQTKTFISGIYGTTSSFGTAVYVNGSGQLGTTTSSRRFKEEISDMGNASDGLLKLRPVSFVYKPEYDDGSRLRQYGLIAEEVGEIYPDLVAYDKDGQPATVRHHFVNAMLLNEVQKQHRTIESQKERIDLLEERLARLEALLSGK